jgi:hypothetical protein
MFPMPDVVLARQIIMIVAHAELRGDVPYVLRASALMNARAVATRRRRTEVGRIHRIALEGFKDVGRICVHAVGRIQLALPTRHDPHLRIIETAVVDDALEIA